VKPEPASPGGPNRLARKEEARRQREALRRKMARRRTMRVIGAVVAVLLVASGTSVYLVLKPTAAEAADCTAVQTVAPWKGGQSFDRSHFGTQGSKFKQMPPLSKYPSPGGMSGAHFPASGPHNPTAMPAGVYASPPPIDKMIHSLEHASVEIWYNPSIANSPELAKIRDFYRQKANGDHVLVAPFNYPSQGTAGKFPSDKQIVFVAWHHLQACGKTSLGAAQSFVGAYRYQSSNPAAYKGDAPEKGAAI
jgi:hypothetical protein